MNHESKPRILVVDDEPSVLLTYRLILEQTGYEVIACGTSREAIEWVQKQTFDVILCDFSLEEQHTGFEVISAARGRNPEVPAALLTGYATRETADEAAAMKVGIMFKPIEIEEFLTTTSKMLRRTDESDEQEVTEESTGAEANGQGRQSRARNHARRGSAGGGFRKS